MVYLRMVVIWEIDFHRPFLMLLEAEVDCLLKQTDLEIPVLGETWFSIQIPCPGLFHC